MYKKFLLLVLAACSIATAALAQENPAPNYHQLDAWAAHPWKRDASDSVPVPLRKTVIRDSVVDVFFVHPTTLTNMADASLNARIDDAALNTKTDNSAILNQASAFNGQTRVFAPRYRQAHYRNYLLKDTSITKPAFDTAYADVKQAFLVFLREFNQGRPFIIASHSQGTQHAARLIKELVEGTPLQNRLVCAYLIGMPVPAGYFSNIPACKDSLATGCVVSWRTMKRGYEGPDYVQRETKQMIVTNPLTWTMDSSYAPASLNSGGVLRNFNKLVPAVTDAQVHGNILWSGKPKFFGSVFLTAKNYHIADINLFYNNIRQNMATRIRMFWK